MIQSQSQTASVDATEMLSIRSIDTDVLSAGFATYCPPVISDVIPQSELREVQ